MAKVRVKLLLASPTPSLRGSSSAEGATVEAALQAAIDAEPRLQTRLYRDGKLCVACSSITVTLLTSAASPRRFVTATSSATSAAHRRRPQAPAADPRPHVWRIAPTSTTPVYSEQPGRPL